MIYVLHLKWRFVVMKDFTMVRILCGFFVDLCIVNRYDKS